MTDDEQRLLDRSARGDSAGHRHAGVAETIYRRLELITALVRHRSAQADNCEARAPPAARPQQPIPGDSVQDIAYLDEIADTILPTTQALPQAPRQPRPCVYGAHGDGHVRPGQYYQKRFPRRDADARRSKQGRRTTVPGFMTRRAAPNDKEAKGPT